MALTEKVKHSLRAALGRRNGTVVAAAIDTANGGQAASIAAIGATSNLVGVDGTGSNAAPLDGTEARLDVIEAKVDAVIDALKDAGLMET